MTGTFGTFSNTMNDLANTLGYTSSDYTYVNKAVPFLDSHDKERIASLQPNRGIEHAALAFLLTSRAGLRDLLRHGAVSARSER